MRVEIGTDVEMAYVPNGDGARNHGRIPYLDVPAGQL